MKKTIIILTVAICILAIGITQVSAEGGFSKVFDSILNSISGEILIKETDQGNKVISGAYILKGDVLQEIQTKKFNITINNGKENEYSFKLLQFIKDGKIVTVRPETEGEAHNLVVGKSKVLFTDEYAKSLWLANIETLDPVNIQPETVDNYSQAALFKKKDDLAKEGKDVDEIILYWAANPIISPDESLVAFASNRHGYPHNLNTGLWVTTLSGKTYLLFDESSKGSIIPICFENNDKIVYVDSNNHLKKVAVHTGVSESLLDKEVMVTGSSLDGRFIMYQYIKEGFSQPEHFMYDLKNNKEVIIPVPSGYKTNAFYGWDNLNTNVAFYVQDFSGNIKLFAFNCITAQSVVLDPPEGTKFDLDTVPSWSEGRVIFAAGGRLYSSK